MADTWRQAILAEWTAAQTDVQAALATAGLDPLRQWIAGEPRPLPQTGGPLVWWHWDSDGTDEISEQLAYQSERVAIVATALLEAPTPAELMGKEASYLPVIIGALERRPWSRTTRYAGSERVLTPRGQVSWTPTLWLVDVDRSWGAAQ